MRKTQMKRTRMNRGTSVLKRSAIGPKSFAEAQEKANLRHSRPPRSLKPGTVNPSNGGNRASQGLSRGKPASNKVKPLTPAKRADIKFSLMIRELALWICARCHDNYSTRRDFFDCSHFFRRNKYATRYDPENADGLCRNCHTGKPFPYEEEKHEGGMYYNFMLRKLGESGLESLRQKSESRCKLRDAVEAFEAGQR